MGQNRQVQQSLLFVSCSQHSHRCSRQQKVEGADSVFASGLDDPRSVVIKVRLTRCTTTVLHAAIHPLDNTNHSLLQWYLPGSNAQFSNPIVESDYEFQLYALDITSYIGTSEQGVATALVIPSRLKIFMFGCVIDFAH
jgi:hypothetical protein